jgi:NitT/TauT family transport system substrate-binding protein
VASLGLVLAVACEPAPVLPPTPLPSLAPGPTEAPLSRPLVTPGGTAEPASSPAAARLKVSYSGGGADNLPEWMAVEAGYFKQQGLDVELTSTPSTTGLPALRAGQVQIAQVGGSEALSAAASGSDLVIVGVIGPVSPYELMAPASIASVDQLKGKKIGISSPGSTSDVATRVALRKSGLDPDNDVTLVPAGSLENRVAALLSGAIDAGLVLPPARQALEAKGFHVVYDLAAQKLPSVDAAVVVQRMWLNLNRDVVQRYVDAIVEGIARSRQDKTQAIAVLQTYLKTDDQSALGATYDFFVGQVIPQYPAVRADLFASAIAELSPANDGLKGYDVTRIVDNTFVQSAADRHVGGP